MKISLYLVILFVLTIALFGCGKKADTTESKSDQSQSKATESPIDTYLNGLELVVKAYEDAAISKDPISFSTYLGTSDKVDQANEKEKELGISLNGSEAQKAKFLNLVSRLEVAKIKIDQKYEAENPD